jgi:hypothetical protein
VIEVLFDRLTAGELPGPRAIAEELSPAVARQHLQMWTADPDEQALFDRLDVEGSAERDVVDSFGIYSQNGGGKKIDWFLHRDVTYDVEWDPATGSVEGTITATIRNDAPAEGLPPSIIGWGGDPGDWLPPGPGRRELHADDPAVDVPDRAGHRRR